MPVPEGKSPAFCCKTCGHLEQAAAAGENALPHACPCCGAGVRFDARTGLKTPEPDNWEVLADATKKRLKELGVEEADRHEPKAPKGAVHGKHHRRTAEDGAASEDRG